MGRRTIANASPARALASALASLLAVAWVASLFRLAIRLHRLDLGGGGGGVGRLGEDDRRVRGGSEDVHVVFSTDCSGYQHWQSIASYYSLRRAGHAGSITRIVSGCTREREGEIRSELRYLGAGGRSSSSSSSSSSLSLGLHFTPSHALGGGRYKYSNKPGGMLDWIVNRTTTTTGASDGSSEVVALVDPDMLAMRPVVSGLGEGLTPRPVDGEGYRDLVEYVDDRGNVALLRRGGLPPLPPRVADGIAAGQHFGLGGMWASAGTNRAGPDFRDFDLTSVCGKGSPCLNVPRDDGAAHTTRELADASYAAGPIYIATTGDWFALLHRWYDFTPRVHAQYPKLLAEMFAFAMAAADMRLKFALSSSYMVSDPHTMSMTESWMWIDEYGEAVQPTNAEGNKEDRRGKSLRRVCEGSTPDSLPIVTTRRMENYGYGNYRNRRRRNRHDGVKAALPTFLHYCQNYKLANHTFAKRKVPHDFFRCDGSLLAFDVSAMVKELDSIEDDVALSSIDRKRRTRTGFMLCHIIPLMNMALIDYKRDVCEKKA
ncbi:hypothetical protein ACHAW5_010382 [Stephanodiscus triporus]|uniref:Protein xylosyltransferase n=1 Tax=Stephanodiscus triporus TaxID=2934178 RepID=A0ABD3QA03_9STRA